MARYEDDYDRSDEPPRRPRPTKTRAGVLETITYGMLILLIGIILFVAWPDLMNEVKIRAGLMAAPTPSAIVIATSPRPAIGGQAPPAVRSTNADAPVAAPANPNVAGNDATAQTLVNASIAAQNGAQPALVSTPVLAPLPLNSAGQPIIDARQQQQLDQSAQLAAQEAAEAQRAAQLADAASRPPDVSADQVATMTGRNPCSVPRADPATCDKGLYKPTPVN